MTVGIEVGMGVKPVATQKIFTQGDYQSTGNSFDMAIEGDGFFQVDDNGETVYTRAGNFKVNKDGILCTTQGLKLIPEVSVPSNTVSFTLDSGGTWTASDANGKSVATGRLELAKFVNPAGLSSMGRNLFAKTEASGEPTTGNPGEDGLGTTSQYYLEMSNVK